MSTRKRTALLLLGLIAFVVLSIDGTLWAKKPPKPPPEPDPPPVQYWLTPIGADADVAYDINIRGDIAGRYRKEGENISRASVYLAELGMMFDLNDIAQVPDGWAASMAFGINKHGQVVGAARDETDSDNKLAFLYDPNADPDFVLLPRVGSYKNHAWKINDHGDIVGIWRVTQTEAYAFLCPAGGVPADLGLPQVILDTGTEVDINNEGQIVTTAGDRLTPVTPGTYADGFIEEHFPGLFIKAINDSGTFVGGTQFYGTTPRTREKLYDGAFQFIDPGPEEILYQWTPGHVVNEEGGGRWNAYATDINSSGHVVLHGVVDGGREESFLYTTQHGLLNLSDLVVGEEADLATWEAATAIRVPQIGDGDPNDTGFGQITVSVEGVGPDGRGKIYLLTPIPPSD